MCRSFLLFILCFVLFGCNITRKVPHGSYLLHKNEVHISFGDSVKRTAKFPASDLYNYIPSSQTPNKRIIGIPLYLSAYNLIDTSKKGWFQRIFRKIGEPPVIYDSTATQNSVKDMTLFLRSKGFYSATVTDTVKTKRNRAKVFYNVTSGPPMLISSIAYHITDTSIKDIVLEDTTNSLIKRGLPISRNILAAERNRIASRLENLGFYNFSVKNIDYDVDTVSQKVTLNVSKTTYRGESQQSAIFRIRNIYINTTYESFASDTVQYDTINYNGVYIIHKKGIKQNLRPKVIVQALTIYPNYIYSKKEINYTSANLNNLRLFKNVNILFNDVPSPENEYISYVNGTDTLAVVKERYVDCMIECSPMLRQSYHVNGELSTNSNYTGISASVGYSNRNLFKGADLFDISFKTSYDIMHSSAKKNSYEFGASTSLSLPRLIVPFNIARFNRLSRVSTRIELAYNNQNRPYYHRMMSNAAFGYQWSKQASSTFVFKPFNVAYIRVPWIDQDYWNSIENQYLRTSYTSQLILGMFGSYVYTNKSTADIVTHTVKINGETSGNFLNLMSVILNSRVKEAETDPHYNAFGVRYAEYFRADMSYVVNFKIKERSALVFRILGGGGYAYGNTKALPFERMFFAGGASSMRGWQVRMLGPGNTPAPEDKSYPDQVGNIRLEANLEGRFPIIGPLNGAIFLDCGNIWMNGKGKIDPEAKFKFNNFANQLALNTGIGARFDFNFFILRLDWGIQLRNPGWAAGHEWIDKFSLRNTALHFGIGYPF